MVGRWATAKNNSMSSSPYANEPFFHIQRIYPEYQNDKELLRLMAKLNSIRNEETMVLQENGYRKFVFLFERSNTNLPNRQLDIGQAYDEGYGLWDNKIEAVKWYKKAAGNGNADALSEVGDCYLNGRGGIEKNIKIGMKLMHEAIEKGSAIAAHKLGSYYVPYSYWKRLHADRSKAIKYYLIAAKRGYVKSFYSLANQYFEDGNGTEALRWANGGGEPDIGKTEEYKAWTARCLKADRTGLCSYVKGQVYAFGTGKVQQNLSKARKLFEESCRSKISIPSGAIALSAMYKEGVGVNRDKNLAEQWRRKAVTLYNFQGAESNVDYGVNKFIEKLKDVCGNISSQSTREYKGILGIECTQCGNSGDDNTMWHLISGKFYCPDCYEK